MTKSKWIVVVVLACALITVGAFKRTSASNAQPTQAVQNQDPHQHHQQSQQARVPSEMPPLLADGATNPQAIPDLIAYEILFNSVAIPTAASEVDRLRANNMAEQTDLSSEKIETLRSAANSFRDKIANLDAQAKVIKDRHWPKPGAAAQNDLIALQKRKEAVLRQEFNSLTKQLNDEEQEKLNSRLLEIKRGVRAYQELPIEAFQR